MRIKSPLSNLSDAINQVKISAAQYQQTLRRNEAATRAVLIDPILRALGWDTANTYMVEVEKTLAQTRVDYALYDHNADVKIIIEAKALGGNLHQQNIVMSLVTYAFTYGIQDIFLTDGLVWEHYTNFQPGNVASNVINFSQDNSVDCAAYLVQRLDAAKFWPEEQTIDTVAQQVAQLESMVSTLQKELAQLKTAQPPSNATKPVLQTPAPITNSPTIQADHKFIELNALPNVAKTKPSLFRLPDGSIIKVAVWKDVLRECCKYALAHNDQIPIPLPDRAGKKVSLFNTVKPATGIAYVEEEYQGQHIYIYVNYDANNCVSNALHVLKYVPSSAIEVQAGVIYEKVEL
jgi:hypothetical protein